MDSNQECRLFHGTPEETGVTSFRFTTEQIRLGHMLCNMVDTKGQQTVSLTRIAKELGVEPLTQHEISQLIEDRK
ncbi:hypothetical protein NVP2044O_48 [Vibrio phage 2.044.O._10N.261.51.B8]|nr:hypothetical protein NVP2044O_48 [Vibrio phage 2.044.O._10N.261.51.B8]